jgi:hypothetical protein
MPTSPEAGTEKDGRKALVPQSILIFQPSDFLTRLLSLFWSVEKGNVRFSIFFHVAFRSYFTLRGAQNIHWTRHGKKE